MASLKDLIVRGVSRFIGDVNAADIYAEKHITIGGASTQFLKGDGTLDSSVYITSAALGSYLPLAGGTMTGAITTSTSGAANDTTKGINFGSGAHIGGNSNNAIGLYSIGSIYIRPSQTSLSSINTNGLVLDSASITFNTKKVWWEGNDGANSGLDADLLDGHHGSYYAASSDIPTLVSSLENDANYIVGPSTSIKENIPIFDNETGNLAADSGISIQRLWEDYETVSKFGGSSAQYKIQNCYINSTTNEWENSTTYRHWIFPLENIRKITVIANNANPARIAFLKSYTPATDSTIPSSEFSSVSGFTSLIIKAVGTTTTYIVPHDAKYLYVYAGATSSYTHKPSSITMTGIGVTEHKGDGSGFIKDDGSVDTNTYAASSSLGNYLPLAGGSMSGAIDFGSTSSITDITKGINFNTLAHIGCGATTGSLGVYNKGSIFIRHNQTNMPTSYDTNYGLILNGASITFNNNKVWHAGNDGSGSELDADLLDGKHGSEYVHVRPIESTYNNKASWNLYTGSGFNGKYIRITFPEETKDVWAMIYMELSILQDYNTRKFGKMTMFAYHSSTVTEWSAIKCVLSDNLTTPIAVYGSDKRYIYIGGLYSYANISINKIQVSDAIRTKNLTGITLDIVDALPESYITATIKSTGSTIALNSASLSLNDAFGNTISSIPTASISSILNIPAAQVNADWNAASGVAQILNKPTIPAAACDATLTIKGDGTYLSVGNSNAGDTFTANASSPKTITVSHAIKTVSSSTSSVTLDLTNASSASRQLSIITHTFDNAGHETTKDTKTVTFSQITDTKVTQTVTNNTNSSWRPLLLGSSYSDATTFSPQTVTNITYATHLAKFKPQTGVLAIVGLNKMETNGKVTTGSNNVVWNTNGGTTTLNSVATTGSCYEANLKWGGRNIADGYSPTDAAMVGRLGANRSAYINPNAVTVEYSRDNGTTWLDYGATDWNKTGFFTDFNSSFTIGKSSTTNPSDANCLLRVTLRTGGYSMYTVLNKFIVYISVGGSSGCYCTITARTQANFINNVDTWFTIADKVYISGWSGYDVINTTNFSTYGNTQNSQYGEIRFLFGTSGKLSGYESYAGLTVYGVNCYGGAGWSTPSNLAKDGHIYSYSSGQNVTFPSNVTAASFIKTGGTSSQFLKADGSVDSNAYITSTALTDYVNLTGDQTITGKKTFTKGIVLNTDTSWNSTDRGIPFSTYSDDKNIMYVYTNASKGFTYNPNTGMLKAGSFMMRGKTNDEILLACGSTMNISAFAAASNVVTSITTATGSYNGVTNASGVVSFNIPSDTNHLTNGAGFITASQDKNTTLSGIGYCTSNSSSAKNVILPGFELASTDQRILVYMASNNTKLNATLSINGESSTRKPIKIDGNYTTESNFPSGWWICQYDGTNWNLSKFQLSYSNITNTPTLATVATTGNYNDLSNTPTITDEKVKRTLTTGSDEYPVIFSSTTDTSTSPTETARYSASLKANGNGDVVFTKSSTKCKLQYDSTNLCLNFMFE